MKDLGYGEGYERYPENDLLPEKLQGRAYLKAPRRGDAEENTKKKAR